MNIGIGISIFKNGTQGSSSPVDAEFLPTTSVLVVDLKSNSPSNYDLTVDDIDRWINLGVGGMDATSDGVTYNKPAYDSVNNAVDFNSANSERMKFECPIMLDGDPGYSILLGLDQNANDRYIYGEDNGGGADLFNRAASLNVQWTDGTSRIVQYSGWDTYRTGKFILEITKKPFGALQMRLLTSGGYGPISTGNSGTLLHDISFFNMLGWSSRNNAYFTGKIAAMKLYNKPFEDSGDANRDAGYADIASYFTLNA